MACLIIGEVAQAHDGSLGLAHAFIDAIADAGADAVKFQTHLASGESTYEEPWRVRFSPQDATRYDYWKRMEFSEEQWAGLKRHADDLNLTFLSSPFSIEALELLQRIGVSTWKVASGEAGHLRMIDRMIGTGLPIILSSGMSSLAELDAVVDRIRAARSQYCLLQCTSAYPCPPEKVGLNLIPFFKQRYACPVGLSDHSGTIYPGLAAATIGIEVLEVHVTLSREMFGPDTVASVTTAELHQLVEGVRFIEGMNASPLDKDAMAVETAPLRALFTKSVGVRADIPAGTVLRLEDLTLKKPGTGIPAARLEDVVGLRTRRFVSAAELLRDVDLEGDP
jgi:N,N'-diacetyllegionaminate synthase